jgi:two-component system sensor histidine kinase BarA
MAGTGVAMMDGIQAESAAPAGLLQTMKSWFHTQSADLLLPQLHPEFSRTSAARSRNQSTRVLVVDDNPCNLGAISQMLEQCGISSLLAADGAEAVLLCNELDFDLVLMDLQMPVLDGLVATSIIRRREALHARPNSAIVAFGSSALTRGLLESCGFSGTLSKPCSLVQLEACLVRWCPNYQPFLPVTVEPGAGTLEIGASHFWPS